jgi:hypothetical protein
MRASKGTWDRPRMAWALGLISGGPRITWAVVFIAAVMLLTGTARANHGTYLPNTSFTLGSGASQITVNNWSNTAPTSFTPNVTQNGTTVGSLIFNYDSWTGFLTSSPSTIAVGAGLSGGFNISNGITVVPGYTLAWAQVVLPVTTIAGNNSWSAPNGTAFPDTSGTTSPAYPFLFVAVGSPAPTDGFQDFPDRFPSSGDQTWEAEDALVGIDSATDTMRIVDSFLWGYGVTDSPAGVTSNAPSLWGAPSTTFVNTETDAFSATGINGVSGTTWTIENNVTLYPVFAVPEPNGVALLLAASIVAMALRPRRATAHS